MSSFDLLSAYLALQVPMTPARLDHKLCELIAHTARRVPYYRELLRDAGLGPKDFTCVADLIHKFPVSRASDYRAVQQQRGPRELIDERLDPGQLETLRSSGSTGVPIVMYRTRRDSDYDGADTLRHLVRAGLRPWHRTLTISGTTSQLDEDSTLQRFGFFWRRTLSHFASPEEVEVVARRDRVNAYYGNISAFEQFADHLRRSGIELPPAAVLYLGAGRVSEASRRYVQEIMRPRRLGEYYGTTETGIIASRTDEYYDADFRAVYFWLKDPVPSGPCTSGSIILTALHNRAQPIINLDVGDLVTVKDYAMHDRLRSTIVSIDGRDNDFMLLADGTRIGAPVFYKTLEAFEFVQQFQVVQKQAGYCDIYIKPVPDSTPDLEQIRTAIAHRARGRFEFDIRLVDHIALSETGKRKVMVSRASHGDEHRT